MTEADTPEPHHPLLLKAEIEASLEFAQNGLAPETGCMEAPLGDPVGLGGAGFGVNFVRLEPNKQAWPLHFHMNEYEWVYILSGSAMYLSLDATDPSATQQETRVEPGDYVGWPAGVESPKHAHAFRATEEGCDMLCGGSRSQLEIVGYPQHDRAALGDRTREPHRRKFLPGFLADIKQQHPRDSPLVADGAAPPHPPLIRKAEIESSLKKRSHPLMPGAQWLETRLSDILGLDRATFGINFIRCGAHAVSGPAHYHSNESEFVYIVRGSGTLTHIDARLADAPPSQGSNTSASEGLRPPDFAVETHELNAGDFVGWPNGQRGSRYAHTIKAGPDGAEWICGGSRAEVEICAYPLLRTARLIDRTGDETRWVEVPHF